MEDFRRFLDPIGRKIRMMAGRAVLKLMKNAVSIQVQGLEGEVRDAAELFQQYGFRSKPLPGAEGILLSLGGNRDHTVVICLDDRRYQLELLQKGEVAVYTDEGDYLHFKRERTIEINTVNLVVNAENSVEFNTTSFAVNASSSIAMSTGSFGVSASAGSQMETGLLQVTGGDIKADNISLKHHLHTGVTPGSGSTGEPQ